MPELTVGHVQWQYQVMSYMTYVTCTGSKLPYLFDGLDSSAFLSLLVCYLLAFRDISLPIK